MPKCITSNRIVFFCIYFSYISNDSVLSLHELHLTMHNDESFVVRLWAWTTVERVQKRFRKKQEWKWSCEPTTMRTERINQSKIRTRCNKLKTNVNEKEARNKVVKETNRVHEARATAASQPASSNTAQATETTTEKWVNRYEAI